MRFLGVSTRNLRAGRLCDVPVSVKVSAVAHAAREGARAAAVAADTAGAARRAAEAAVHLEPGRLAVTTAVVGDLVRVTVRYRAPTEVPIVGAFVHDVALVETVTMAVEP